MKGSERVIYALDIGVLDIGAAGQVLASTTAAWCRLDGGSADFAEIAYAGSPTIGRFTSADGWIGVCGRSIEELAKTMAKDLEHGRRIALGFEAPMWVPLQHQQKPGLRLFRPRFPTERDHGYYLQAGAAATVKAFALGEMLCSYLREIESMLRFTTSPEEWSPGTILLFEAFVAGQYKGEPAPAKIKSPNEWDALIAALAFGALHANFLTPSTVRGEVLHMAGSCMDSCLSIWKVILDGGSIALSGPPDCEVVGLKSQPAVEIA